MKLNPSASIRQCSMMWITAMNDMDGRSDSWVGCMEKKFWNGSVIFSRIYFRSLLGLCGGMILGVGVVGWAPIASASLTLESEDIPEEILRQSVILDARSPLDGQPLTAQEYAELQVEIERLNAPTPKLSPKLQQLVTLLKLRKLLKTILPIVPIK